MGEVGLRKNVKLTCIIIFCLFAILYFLPQASADAPKPEWVNGDKWEYTSSVYGILTTTTTEYDGVETITVNETSYDVYIIKKDETTSAYGFNLTYPGHAYYQRSDMGMVKMDQTMTLLGMTSSDVTTYAPPKKDCKFPLSVGQIWTETFTEITYSSMDDEIITYDEETYTNTYIVSLEEEITVTAGTFDTYKIECEDEDGYTIYSWYAPEVKNFVKMSSGGVTTQLSSYEVTPPKSSHSGDGKEGGSDLFVILYFLVLILILIIVAVLAVSHEARKRKKRAQAQVADQPTVDFSVQSAYVAQPPAHPRPMSKTKPVVPAASKQTPPPPPAPPPVTPVYPCPTCSQPLELIKQYNRWYCRNCKKYP
jgi:heme/copper-type cytochrome/quinol oxidase subunit 2